MIQVIPEWFSGFLYFLQFEPEFCNKELMIWATGNFRSCFCWLYRASPSLVTKNTVNLISVSTIWWYPCVEWALVLLKEGVCYDPSAFSWQSSLSLCSDSFCTLRPNLPVTPGSLDFLLLHSSPLWWKGQLFLVLVLAGLVGLHTTTQIQLLWN